ncbi:ABC transporter ATP-binding protein [Rhodonellum sp.]|uniref:ABC transporter ATP-binding protein n=1 Tax=Rhodonellum sp. TaxID=2231180 RepID=UPI0027239636|nr:ABC transporter ATP-binding protein [Rhodonellum sp.]MDO9551300.1 ABC transporter ATP-binding protein [Rhodonellum sp.]
MTERIISVEHLRKRYGKQLALNEVSFVVEKGQVLGVVGPNGSGKTTLFSILLGLRKPNSGSFSIFGQTNPEDVRAKVGVILDQGNFYAGISAKKNLTISAMTKNIPLAKVDELLEKVGLGEVGSKPFKSFSYGMKKRLEIADALLSDPELVIMDEPTNGLDPEGVIFIRELIMELKRQGKTIVLSSHYLEEIQKVCTHFLILKKGELVFHGSQEAVLGKFDSLESALTNKL